MTVAVLISGSIFREPQARLSQSGKRFVTTTIKVGGDRDAEFWGVLAFGTTAGDELMRLAVGERLTIQGGLKLEIFEKDGQARISPTVFADSVLALRQPPKERKPKAAAKAPTSQATTSTDPDLNDEIGF